MMHTFSLTALNQPAVIERILRVIRHRGFNLEKMDLVSSEESVELTFTVSSEREVNLLFNQLEKLYDVVKIEVNCEKDRYRCE